MENLSLCQIKNSLSWSYLYAERVAKLVVACSLNIIKSGTATVNLHVMKLFVEPISNSELLAWKNQYLPTCAFTNFVLLNNKQNVKKRCSVPLHLSVLTFSMDQERS